MPVFPFWIGVIWWFGLAAALPRPAYWAVVAFWFLMWSPMAWVSREEKRLSWFDMRTLRRALHIAVKKDLDLQTEWIEGDKTRLHIYEKTIKAKTPVEENDG